MVRPYSRLLMGCAVIVVVTAAFLSLIPSANATEAVIQPGPGDGSDAYIREDNPNNNYGNTTSLYVGLTGTGHKMRGLFQFNISGIPQGSTIINASLEAYLFLSASSLELPVGVHRVTAMWEKGSGNSDPNSGSVNGTTWNERWFGTSWASQGGDFNSTPEDTINLTQTTGWYSWSVGYVVKDWLDGNESNFGLILVSDEVTDEYKGLRSSDYTVNASRRPILRVNYAPNVPPNVINWSDDSNQSYPTNVGDNVSFTAYWNDVDSSEARLFVCNSTSIGYGGCGDREFCSTGYSSSSPLVCEYTTQQSDSHTESYWFKLCDNEGDCTSISPEYNFSVNHAPVASLLYPNGGETINQTEQGNYNITFLVSDIDGHNLTASIYYSESAGGRDFPVVLNLSLNKSNCDDPDNTTVTENNCSFSWNSSDIAGTFWMTVDANDTWLMGSDTSDGTFDVKSLIDFDPPNITNVSITDNLTSGELARVSANVTEPHISSVWMELNNTQGQKENISMAVDYGEIYFAEFECGEAGLWSFRVLANDTNGNRNETSWFNFTVSQPNATTSDESYPSKALPYSIILIKGKLIANDVLRDVYAYLNIDSEFSFQGDYPQNRSLGNISAGQEVEVEWFLSVPGSQGLYTFNITYTDRHANEWESASYQVQVTSALGGIFVDINSQPEIEAGDDYTAEILVRDGNGNYIDPAGVRLTLIDPMGNTIVDNVNYTSQISTGIYNYTYSTSGGQIQGQWLLIANVTYDGAKYEDRQFWRLVGGPFDVRNIVVSDNVVPGLVVSVELENTGGVGQDMTVVWNLTRVDNGGYLDSGSDTVLVPAYGTETHTVNPSTNYIGNVRIAFLGYYSGTERAGAFDTFSTQAAAGPEPPGGGAGRAREGPITVAPGPQLEFISLLREINVYPGQSTVFDVVVKNIGGRSLQGLYLELEGVNPSWYGTSAASVDLNAGESSTFSVNLTIPGDAMVGTYPFSYVVKSGQDTLATSDATLYVLSEAQVLSQQLMLLVTRISDLIYTIQKALEKGYDVSEPDMLVGLAEDMLGDIEIEISNRRFEEARRDLDIADKYLDDAEDRLKYLGIEILKRPRPLLEDFGVWIITWILIVILIVITIKILKRGTRRGRTVVIKERRHRKRDDEDFWERLRRIREQLRD